MSAPRPHQALQAWSALVAAGGPRGALVTLVGADGGTSKLLGTQLAITDDGRAFGSVTIGGCADGRAVAAAREAVRNGMRALLDLPLSEADALALGLGCAGDIELVVEPVELGTHAPLAVALAEAEASLARGERAALVTPLEGALGRLLVRADGSAAGSLGSPARDATAAERVARRLADVRMESGIEHWEGERWFVQLLAPPPIVLVIGATDVAAAFCAVGAPLGWRTVLIDPRDDLLAEPRFAPAGERESAMPADAVAAHLRGEVAAVVILAHDYKVELPVLRIALRSAAPYVGMLGSAKRAAAVRGLLADDGLTADELARLHAPIGIRIGAKGPAEIAVSIAAEVIATMRAATAAPTEA